MVSRVGFTVFVALVAFQRLAELGHSRKNEAGLRARGAVEHAPWQVPILAAIHAGWLASMLVEVWLVQASFQPWVAFTALLAFIVGQGLRLAAIRTLGDRWTVRVFTLPGTPRVTRGLYSRLRHPNYVGVALEMAALPLIHGALVTAVAFSGLNAAAMVLRLGVESRALAEAQP